MEEAEPLNELCVVTLLFHSVHGLLLSYTEEGVCKLTDVCGVEVGDAWPEAQQRSLFEKFGSFTYEIVSLAKMETFTSEELWDSPRFGLFVICQTDDAICHEKDYQWENKNEELEKIAYCHPLFKKLALEVIKNHYPTQLQFSL